MLEILFADAGTNATLKRSPAIMVMSAPVSIILDKDDHMVWSAPSV